MSYWAAVFKETLKTMGRDFAKCEGLHIFLFAVYAVTVLFSGIFSLVVIVAYFADDVPIVGFPAFCVNYMAGNIFGWIMMWVCDAYFRTKDKMR